MARTLSGQQSALADYLAQGSHHAVGKYIEHNARMQNHIQKFFGAELDVGALVAVLKTGGKKADKAREVVDRYIDTRAGKLPFNSGRVPLRLRWKLPHKTTMREKALGALFAVEAIGALLLGNTQADAAISAEEIESVLDTRDKLGITQTFNAPAKATSEARYEPLEITITKPMGFMEEREGALTGVFDRFDKQASRPETDSPYLLSPYLIKAIQEDAQKREYFDMITGLARSHGLDDVLFANQIFRESGHFNQDVVNGTKKSPAGAIGIGQFTPETAKEKFNMSEDDLTDPAMAIVAAALHMKKLTDEYNGDQIMALIAYNGGPGAINFIYKKSGPQTTGIQALGFLQERFEKLGNTKDSAYHVETRKYMADITGAGWSAKYRNWAVSMNEKFYGESKQVLAYGIPLPQQRPN